MRAIAQVLDDRACLVGVPSMSEAGGILRPFDFSELPFRPQLMFVIGDIPPGTVRTERAHRTALRMLVCLSGKVEVEVGYRDQTAKVTLDSMDEGLVISPKVWSRQTFVEPGSQLLVLASEPDGGGDYVSDRHANEE
jgi:hypothetical protein